jgi:hypothetical protein
VGERIMLRRASKKSQPHRRPIRARHQFDAPLSRTAHMAKTTQRKEEILKSELPPTLPLMALRSTIVYPLGTIAVQMGAPENLSLLRAFEEPGLIVALVVATGDHDEPVDTSASISPETRSRSLSRGCDASSSTRSSRMSRFPSPRFGRPRRHRPTRTK